jgi:hypothetical protein
MVRTLPDGEDDTVAFLAGRELPSQIRKAEERQTDRRAFAALAGGNVVGEEVNGAGR